MVQYLTNLVVFLKRVELFLRQLGHIKKENTFAVWERLLKLDGSCGIWEKSYEIRATGCGKLTADRLTKVTAVCLSMYTTSKMEEGMLTLPLA